MGGRTRAREGGSKGFGAGGVGGRGTGLIATKRRKMIFFEGGMGGGTRAREGGSRGFGSGGVGGRGTGPRDGANFATASYF